MDGARKKAESKSNSFLGGCCDEPERKTVTRGEGSRSLGRTNEGKGEGIMASTFLYLIWIGKNGSVNLLLRPAKNGEREKYCLS